MMWLSQGTRAVKVAAPGFSVLPAKNLLLAFMLFFAMGPAAGGAEVKQTPGLGTEENWSTIGRTYKEQFFSPLAQINVDNVKNLGLAWYKDLGTTRGLESTPLVVDGVMYNIAPFNVVTAIDARTGKDLWTYDPEVPREVARITCCDVVSRGLAVWKDKVIIAALDGRLIAVDSHNGKPVWSVQTFAGEPDWSYTITGAPRVFDGKVLIGNGGADLGARGFVTAYDVDTGKKLWRFYTVPGDPAKGFENKAMEMAAKTWNGEWWKWGGGGTAWDAITYDPELKLIYIGVGNGSPWVQKFRSPGGGDNLFLTSIVAVKADTGEYVWHFQEVPGEQFDSTATQPMVLADLTIAGKLRKVLMQAPKNGFFYVLDRVTGKFISAGQLVNQNWTTALDPVTGRATLTPTARYDEKPVLITPAFIGSHNWNPMAYSPLTGLVYLSVNENAGIYQAAREFKPEHNVANTGMSFEGNQQELRQLQDQAASMAKAWLSAWDPVQQRERWRVNYPANASSGVLATAGNLVFQGTAYKTFAAYRADTGEKVWEMPVDNIPMAAPMSYMLDGVQYIAVNAGFGGGLAHIEMSSGRGPVIAKGRLLVFRLAGNAMLPPMPPEPPRRPPPRARMTDAQMQKGQALYSQYCQVCHGTLVRGGVKDLRFMDDATRESFSDIVLKGIRKDQGMASFANILTPEDVATLYGYVTVRAYDDYGDN
jgi:quinohemoprotein ethanol dehydrogenase